MHFVSATKWILYFSGSSPFGQDQQPQPFQSLPPVMYGDGGQFVLGGGGLPPQPPPPGVASNNNSSSSSSTLTSEVTPSTIAAKKQNWNPFEDSQSFSQMSADALFGAEFDRIRQTTAPDRPPASSAVTSQAAKAEAVAPKTRTDPFQSAPFMHLS